MSAHTPGPWNYRDANGTVEAPNGGIVAMMGGTAVKPTMNAIDTINANGRLLAAAPDLLAALRDIRAQLNSGGIHIYDGPGSRGALKAMENARAAIAKAEGKS